MFSEPYRPYAIVDTQTRKERYRSRNRERMTAQYEELLAQGQGVKLIKHPFYFVDEALPDNRTRARCTRVRTLEAAQNVINSWKMIETPAT